ncbi:Acetyltransferase (GNAT) family protein [compost metagenome]
MDAFLHMEGFKEERRSSYESIFSAIPFKGIAAQIFRTLTEWAIEYGAEHLYLQVVASNEAAVTLYQKLGFTITSRYHYRIYDE